MAASSSFVVRLHLSRSPAPFLPPAPPPPPSRQFSSSRLLFPFTSSRLSPPPPAPLRLHPLPPCHRHCRRFSSSFSSSPPLPSSPPPPPTLLHLSRDLRDDDDDDDDNEDDEESTDLEVFDEMPETSEVDETNGVVESLPRLPSPKLTVKEKKELASYAHSLGKKLKTQQVGKSGVTPAVAASFAETLEANELLKIKVHGSCPGELSDAIKLLEQATGSVAVGQIGRSVILYRPSLSKTKKKEAQGSRKAWNAKSTKSGS